MSELQFPKYPIVGQEYDFPPYRYYWDGIKWKTKGVGYNPVNDLQDELEPRISANELQVSRNTPRVFEALRRSYADIGSNLVEGSFEEGGVLLTASDVMITASGDGYSWGGSEFPHNVAPKTDPTAPASGYVPRMDSILRDQLRKGEVFPHLNKAAFGLSTTQYVAHRGLSRIAPENTLPSYEAAGRAGFWGGECDVQLTSDGVWVLMHDDTVDRTTNGSGAVSSLTLATIKTLDAGSWFSSYYAGTRVPTLDEYLLICRRHKLVPVIEIKASGVYSDAQVQSLIDSCLSVFPDYQFVVISFSLAILQQIRNLNDFVELQYVVNTYSTSVVDACVSLGKCWLDVNYSGLPSDLTYATAKGVLLNTWTVDDPDNANYAIGMGVRQITTNFINL